MDKLKLNLDNLEVDSFQASPEQEEAQGTVHGNITQDPDRCETIIGGTCDYTCDCELTCDCC